MKRLVVHEPLFGSVHSPLSLTIDCSFEKVQANKPPIPPPPKFIWDQSKRGVFIDILKSKLCMFSELYASLTSRECTNEDTTNILKRFTDILYESAQSCFKMVKMRKSKKKPNKENSKSWYNNSCRSLRKRLLNQARLLKKNPNDPHIRGTFISCKKEYRTCIKESKKCFEIGKLNEIKSLTNDPKMFWKKVKATLGKSKAKSNNYISSEAWVKHFSSLNKKNPDSIEANKIRCRSIENSLELLMEKDDDPCSIMDRDFSLVEILTGIKSLKKGKASALDAISNDILHCASETGAITVLQGVFNNLIKFRVFPRQWATGIIVPLHKGGEIEDPNNYRGITLNSCISKLFTLLLNNRLSKWCEDNNIIKYNQIGFRKGFRTSDHIFTLKTIIDEAFMKKQKIYVCFIDFKKAYDSVWRNGLFYKLIKNGLSKKFVNFIKNMYKELQFCVSLQNGLSLPFKSMVGLKQGCNLSPLLFNILVNDIPSIVNNNNCDPPVLGSLPVSSLLYADDLILISKSREGLQNAIDELDNFSKDWFIEINQMKTKCMVFSKGRSAQIPNFTIGDRSLSFCDDYCYLGVMFSKSGSFKLASSALADKATNAMFALIKNLYKHRSVDCVIMLDLFDKMISPIALYGVEVWGLNFLPANKGNKDLFDKIHLAKHLTENIHYRFLKMLLGVPRRTSSWAVSTECGRFPMAVKAFKMMCKYYQHLSNTTSPILKAAFDQSKVLSGLGVNSWFKAVSRVLEFGGVKDVNNIAHIDFETEFKRKYMEGWEAEKEVYKITGKLGILANCKREFSMSYYLLSSNLYKVYQRAITKIRLSAHKLPIEVERYNKTPRERRVCPLGCEVVGDEQHFVFECEHPAMSQARNLILSKITNEYPAINRFRSKQEILIHLLSSEDPRLLQLVGKLCHKVLSRFNDILW